VKMHRRFRGQYQFVNPIFDIVVVRLLRSRKVAKYNMVHTYFGDGVVLTLRTTAAISIPLLFQFILQTSKH
jgi:hypothetical protein